MAALDGIITIEKGLRQCIVHIPENKVLCFRLSESFAHEIAITPAQDIKALFHTWNECTGKGIVEYEDGTVHEVEPRNIRFVDNLMNEYVFQKMEEDNASRNS